MKIRGYNTNKLKTQNNINLELSFTKKSIQKDAFLISSTDWKHEIFDR